MQKMSFLNKLSLYMRPKTIYRSEDGYIEVRDSMENKRPVRVLYCDGIRETGIYLDEGMNTDPLFYYMQTLKEITLYYDGLDKALLIGGGGMAFPKYYLSCVPEGQMTVIEKDGRMIDMARKYFYYTEDDRIRIIEGDGTAFISKTATSNAAIVNGKGLKKYDLIIFDAFTGKKTPKELFSEGVFKLTKQINSDKGILLASDRVL